jgi:isoquinoline 1-oxidoreductase beta subunit
MALNRRAFLVAGSLGAGGWLVGCSAPGGVERLGQAGDFAGPGGEVALNAWVRIAPDGGVTVAMPRVEMGQGVHTALALLVAEELEADWPRVAVAFAPVGRVYANTAVLLNASIFEADDTAVAARTTRAVLQRAGLWLSLQATGGSASVRDAWEPMRAAGAAARTMLVQAAARRFGVPAESLVAERGGVSHAASGRRAGFGELVREAAALPVPESIALKPAAQWRLIGREVPRLPQPGALTGATLYGADVRLPGMLHAAIRHCPVMGGRLRAFDPAPALAQPGVRAAFDLEGRAVVVVADRHWRAQRALDGLQIDWDSGPGPAADSQALLAQLRQAVRGPDTGFGGFRDDGDAQAGLDAAEAATKVEAFYEAPLLAHAALEPVNCTAQVQGGRVTLWCPTQVPILARLRAALTAGVWPADVSLHLTAVGGGFGRRLEVDMVQEAVAIAMRLDGAPVQLLWSRQEDLRHDMYRPAAAASFQAALDASGRPVAWLNRVAAPPVSLPHARRVLGLPLPGGMPDKFQLEGAFELPYEIQNVSVRQHLVQTAIPVGYWRSVGHSYNGFFTECFVDELAQAARQDPVAYRLALLAARPRHRAVLELAARQAGWGAPLPAGWARGVALHQSFGSICVQVAEVSIEKGALRVHRVVCALDCGVAVHPDGVRAQMEGSVAFALGAVLRGQITVRDGAVEQANFPAYDVLRLHEMPRVQTHLVASARPPGGVGEVGVPPLAPAVINALAALTGRRVRRLPLRAEDLAG